MVYALADAVREGRAAARILETELMVVMLYCKVDVMQ